MFSIGSALRKLVVVVRDGDLYPPISMAAYDVREVVQTSGPARRYLTLFKRSPLSTKFEPVKTYPIAVGAVGYATPAGAYVITRKAKNPTWTPPNSPWVPEAIRGTTFAGDDPNNPIRAAFLDIHDGVGIHGTADLASIGTAASHGCIRMTPDDVLDLYPRVPKGTPVVIL